MKFFLPTLSLILLTLKLIGYFNYSWWLVFAPIYVPILIGIFLYFIAFIAAAYYVGKTESNQNKIKESIFGKKQK